MIYQYSWPENILFAENGPWGFVGHMDIKVQRATIARILQWSYHNRQRPGLFPWIGEDSQWLRFGLVSEYISNGAGNVHSTSRNSFPSVCQVS
jgi:hypothetical protein